MKHLQVGCKSVCLSAVPYGGGFLIGLVLLDCSSRTKWRLLSSSYLPCLTSGRLLAQTIDKLVLPLLPLSHVLDMVLFCNDQKLRHLLMGSENLVACSAEEGLMWHPWPVLPFATAMQRIGWLTVGFCGCHPPTGDGWCSVPACGHMKWDRQTAKCSRNKTYDTKLSFATIRRSPLHIQRLQLNQKKSDKQQLKMRITRSMYPTNLTKLLLLLFCINKEGRGSGNWLRYRVVSARHRNLKGDFF